MLLIALTALTHADDALAQLDRPDPEVTTYKRPQVIPDEAAMLYVQVYGAPVHCDLALSITDTGEVAHVSGHGCPDSLLASARSGIWNWSFHPPTYEGVAMDASHIVTLEYRANTVALPSRSTDDFMLVRVAPAAVPRWPLILDDARWAQRYLEQHHLSEVTCEASITLKRNGVLDDLEAKDCPEELADNLARLGKRWGFDVVGMGEEMTRFDLAYTFQAPEP